MTSILCWLGLHDYYRSDPHPRIWRYTCKRCGCKKYYVLSDNCDYQNARDIYTVKANEPDPYCGPDHNLLQ